MDFRLISFLLSVFGTTILYERCACVPHLKDVRLTTNTSKTLKSAKLPKEVLPTGVSKEDARLSFEQLAAKNKYPVQTHNVTTEDGYILTVHRIPHGRNKSLPTKGVVLLEHGFLCSSVDWIVLGPPKALAYMLADSGYDVWLGNSRGNSFSRQHHKLNPDKNASFWNFSLDELGYFDLPAIIDYIVNFTGRKKLFHIGFSQGTTSFYIMASRRPLYNRKIAAHFGLAPVAYMSHTSSPLVKLLAFFGDAIYLLGSSLNMNEFLPSNNLLVWFGSKFCGRGGLTQFLCKNALFSFAGFSRNEMDSQLLPIVMGHTPAGTAMKVLVHLAQLIKSGHFRSWDYGFIYNLLKYQKLEPPEYDLDRVTAPVYLFYGSNDLLSAKEDVRKLVRRLPNVNLSYQVPSSEWDHLDFIYGTNANKYVYKEIIKILRELS